MSRVTRRSHHRAGIESELLITSAEPKITDVISSGCVSTCLRERKRETDGQTHTHKHEAGDGPSVGPYACPGDTALAQHPEHSLSGSHEKTLLVTVSPHLLLDPKLYPGSPQTCGSFCS